MAWMETDYSKDTHFRWKIKWRLENLGALGIMGEMSPLSDPLTDHGSCSIYILTTEGSIPGKWMGDRAIREGRSHKKSMLTQMTRAT